MTTNDGGPAFPTTVTEWTGAENRTFTMTGMSLRDHFAGQAMQGLLASGFQTKIAERVTRGDRATVMQALAELAGEVADAMLAERLRK